MDTPTTKHVRRSAPRNPTRNGIRFGRKARTTRPTLPGRFSLMTVAALLVILLCTFARPMDSAVADTNDGSAPTYQVDPATGAPLPVGYVCKVTTPVENIDPWHNDPGTIEIESGDGCDGKVYEWMVNRIVSSYEDQPADLSVSVPVVLGKAGTRQTVGTGIETPICVQTDFLDETGKVITAVIRQPAEYGESNWTGTLPSPKDCVPPVTTIPVPDQDDVPTPTTEAAPPPPMVETPPQVTAPPTTVAQPPVQREYTCEELLAQGKSLACTGVDDVVFGSIMGSNPVTSDQAKAVGGAFLLIGIPATCMVAAHARRRRSTRHPHLPAFSRID